MQIQIGLIKIPVMTLNLYNNQSGYSSLHQFSECCKARVGYKKYCKNCDKELLGNDILKGLDKDTILSKEQENKLKELLENGRLEVLGIKKLGKDTISNIFPYVKNSKILLPSIAKGYKKSDFKTFYSFKESLTDYYAICKLVIRGKEHLVIMLNNKEDLIYVEIPFNSYSNNEEVSRLKEIIEHEGKELNKLEYVEQAKEFLNSYKNLVTQDSVIEEKKQLLKSFVSQIRNGVVSSQTHKREESNPFSMCLNGGKK